MLRASHPSAGTQLRPWPPDLRRSVPNPPPTAVRGAPAPKQESARRVSLCPCERRGRHAVATPLRDKRARRCSARRGSARRREDLVDHLRYGVGVVLDVPPSPSGELPGAPGKVAREAVLVVRRELRWTACVRRIGDAAFDAVVDDRQGEPTPLELPGRIRPAAGVAPRAREAPRRRPDRSPKLVERASARRTRPCPGTRSCARRESAGASGSALARPCRILRRCR